MHTRPPSFLSVSITNEVGSHYRHTYVRTFKQCVECKWKSVSSTKDQDKLNIELLKHRMDALEEKVWMRS